MTGSINRYYDPTTGQFLSVDPDVATTGQPYVFTNDNPPNAEDPLGLMEIFDDPSGGPPPTENDGTTGGGVGDGGSEGSTNIGSEGSSGDETKFGFNSDSKAVDGQVKAFNVSELKMSDVVEKEASAYSKDGTIDRPYQTSTLMIQNIIDSGTPIADPGGDPDSVRWDAAGTFNGSPGTYELVVNLQTDTIYHFVFIGGK